MPRFYVPNPWIKDNLLELRGNEVRHLRNVLRLKPGDEIFVFDGLGKEYEGKILEEKPSLVLIKIESIFSSHKESPIEITLAQSLLKGEKMDYLVQKATELGVTEIIPFFSSRSVPLLEKSKRLNRYHRWERIVIEASKQCGRGVVPKIKPLQNYNEMFQMASSDALLLILWENEGEDLKKILEKSKGKTKVFAIIGPEGGFSKEEVEQAKRLGFVPITLGHRILRAETVSLCLLSILQYEWGDIGQKGADSF